MKIRKSELKNIIDNGWAERRQKVLERRMKASQRTKEWKARVPRTKRLIAKLEQSKDPMDQADAHAIKELLKMISYDF